MQAFHDSELDPVGHLKEYLRRSEGLRLSTQLFVTTRAILRYSQYNIGSWIQKVLSLCGQTGTPGQARSNTTSKALMKGLVVKDIIKMGEWSRESTFYCYYVRGGTFHEEI